MAKMNWGRVQRENKMQYVPSPRSLPSSQAQLNLIVDLCHQKGQQPPYRMPLTKEGASSKIQHLLSLPDVNAREHVRLARIPESTSYLEGIQEIQEALNLSPQTLRSLFHILNQVDELGCAMFFDAIVKDELPANQDELLVYLLKAFISEYA